MNLKDLVGILIFDDYKYDLEVVVVKDEVIR